VLATGAAAAAALTRAPGLALVALAATAAAGGVLLHGRRPAAPRVLAAAGAAAVVGLAAGGSAIGFYLRNRTLYGSLTGAAYNQELFRFEPQNHVLTCSSPRPTGCGSTTGCGSGPASTCPACPPRRRWSRCPG